MKTNKTILISSLIIASLMGSTFATDTTLQTNETSSNVKQVVQVNKQAWQEFKSKIKELKGELKNASTFEEKKAIRNKIFDLFNEFKTNHPWILSNYTHKLFHYTERNEIITKVRQDRQNLRESLKENIKNLNKTTWNYIKSTIRSILKDLPKETKRQIRETMKKYREQILDLRNSVKWKTKEERQNIYKQIINLQIAKMEEIKNILPKEKQVQMDDMINKYKQYIDDKANKRNEFKQKVVKEKETLYSQLSEELKNKIDEQVSNLKTKLDSLSSTKAEKLLSHLKTKIEKIINNHKKDVKNPNSLHFKNELAILEYFQGKLDNLTIK